MRRLHLSLCFSLVSILSSGCSAMMAATGSEEPNLSVLHVGATRKSVQAELGRPISSIRQGYGDEVTFQYFTGDKPNMRRAAVYAVLTGVSLGLTELVTFPAEAVQGDRNVVVVNFDRNGRLMSYTTKTFAAPIDAPEKILRLEEELNPDLEKKSDPGLLRLNNPNQVRVQPASYKK